MVRKWKLGASGSALLATALVVVACSSTKEDDDDAGTGGTGATGATGGSSGGQAPATGGMAPTTGGTGGTTGGSGGVATASGGMPGAGGMAPAGFACTAPTAATCDSIQVWGTFSNGTFGGGLYTYGQLTRDATVTDSFKVSGMVTDYSGFGVYFNSCSSLAAYTGVSFVMTGTSASVAKPNVVRFVVQTNPDEAIDMENMKGMCPGMPGVGCNSPRKEGVAPSDMAQAFLFTDLMGGEPVATVTTTEVLGLQWQIDPDTGGTPFAVDITIDNLTLTGGASAPVECTAPMGGMGGMGSGGAATGGAPAAGGAPLGGAGGTAGAATGGAPSAGTGAGGAATGGMTGGGGTPGGGRGSGGRGSGGRGSAGSP